MPSLAPSCDVNPDERKKQNELTSAKSARFLLRRGGSLVRFLVNGLVELPVRRRVTCGHQHFRLVFLAGTEHYLPGLAVAGEQHRVEIEASAHQGVVCEERATEHRKKLHGEVLLNRCPSISGESVKIQGGIVTARDENIARR